MKRVGWLIAALVLSVGLSAWADCGCAPAGDPACYTTFRMSQAIEFRMTVPVEFFYAHATTETPLITGWRVETLDGAVVRRVVLSYPVGPVTVFEWKLDDGAGARVAEGFYRIVVETTSAGDVSNTVLLFGCCSPCYNLCCCTARPPVCRPLCGDAYLVLNAGDALRPCCGFTITISGSLSCPAP